MTVRRRVSVKVDHQRVISCLPHALVTPLLAPAFSPTLGAIYQLNCRSGISRSNSQNLQMRYAKMRDLDWDDLRFCWR
jgi:hypothetical protein